jgi:hypothetical protein
MKDSRSVSTIYNQMAVNVLTPIGFLYVHFIYLAPLVAKYHFKDVNNYPSFVMRGLTDTNFFDFTISEEGKLILLTKIFQWRWYL